VYELGSDVYEAELEFQSLTEDQKASLASFFKDDASGMQETFTYTDPAGSACQARFADPALVFVQFARDVWDVSLKLELSGLLD
jgi:hypothetical protein